LARRMILKRLDTSRLFMGKPENKGKDDYSFPYINSLCSIVVAP